MRTCEERLALKEGAAAMLHRELDTGSGVGINGLKLRNALVQRRLAIRTRFCDDFFKDCADARGITQARCGGARQLLMSFFVSIFSNGWLSKLAPEW